MSRAKTPLASLTLLLASTLAACASSGQSSADAEMEKALEAALAPASAEERAAANRSDPLTRANFWASEHQKAPQDADIALEFASALRGIGSHDRAVEVLSSALVIHPGNTDMLMMLGRIRMAAGEVPVARTIFEQVTSLAPDRADSWAALGTAYDHLEMHGQAQAAYQRALSIEPKRVSTLTNYGLSLMLSGDLKSAETQLREAATLPGATARVHENLALVLGLQGRFDEMKTVSATGAPESVAEQNARLIRSLVQPARDYDALDPAAPTPATSGPERRQLRRSSN